MLSFPASSRIALLQYFVSSNRARELFFHLQHRSGASPSVTSSGQANRRPVLQSMKRMWLLGGYERNDRGGSDWWCRRQRYGVGVGVVATAAIRGRRTQTESTHRRVAMSCWPHRRGKSFSGKDKRRNQEKCQGAAHRSWRKRRTHGASPPL